MTHDELLAELDSQIEISKAVGCDCKSCDNAKALRAVVELHKPTPLGNCRLCVGIWDNGTPLPVVMPYPCFTIQAIEKELG